jgi:hypothetical protein
MYRSPMPSYAHLASSQRPSLDGSSKNPRSAESQSPREPVSLLDPGSVSPRRATSGDRMTVTKPKWKRIVNEMDPVMTAIYESVESKVGSRCTMKDVMCTCFCRWT